VGPGSLFVVAVVVAGLLLALRSAGPGPLRTAFVVVALVAIAALPLELFERWSWFDTVVHAGGGFVAAPLLVLLGERAGLLSTRPRGATVVLCLAAGAAIGGVWELGEWSVDGLFGSTLQEGLDDSMRDLLADTLAAGLGALLLR
jgi:hypothetical protein